MNLKHYLHLAKLNLRLNDAAIMSRLHLTASELAALRSGGALPGEEAAVLIGEMAGAPPELMLRELAIWRDNIGRKRGRLSLRSRPSAITPASDDV